MMTAQLHFTLIRGLVREAGHWGRFRAILQHHFPTALVTTIDLPGAGTRFRERAPTSVSDMVEQMRQDYLAAKGTNQHAHLVAISLGGMIALEWLRSHPTDFQSATFINTSFGDLSAPHQRLKPSALAHLLPVPLLRSTAAREQKILELVTNHRAHFDETLREWTSIAEARPVGLKNTFRQLLAASRFRTHGYAPQIPVHVLAGLHDRMVDVECSRAIARRWGVLLQEHPTAGHELSNDAPEWIVEQIQTFLKA